MPTLCQDKDNKSALLRGAATIFDLSGTGLLPDVQLDSLDVDLEALRKDFNLIGSDFWVVLHAELERLRKESDGGRR